MLPPNILDLVKKLTSKTNSGDVVWSYDSFNERVSAKFPNFDVDIIYRFNMMEEVGEFILYYTEKNKNEYVFSTTQLYSDYSYIKYLFDSAKSSGLNFNIDF